VGAGSGLELRPELDEETGKWREMLDAFEKNMYIRGEELKVYRIADTPEKVLEELRKLDPCFGLADEAFEREHLSADHFYELVNAGYYDECRFFRVVPNHVAQFGIHGDPAVSAAWNKAPIAPDRARTATAATSTSSDRFHEYRSGPACQVCGITGSCPRHED